MNVVGDRRRTVDEHQALDALRVPDGEHEPDERAEGMADHRCPLDPLRLEQGEHVLDVTVEAVARLGLVAQTAPAQVQSD